jgi:hypothetical protein
VFSYVVLLNVRYLSSGNSVYQRLVQTPYLPRSSAGLAFHFHRLLNEL